MEKRYFVSYALKREGCWETVFGTVVFGCDPRREDLYTKAVSKMIEIGYKEGEYAFISMNEIPN